MAYILILGAIGSMIPAEAWASGGGGNTEQLADVVGLVGFVTAAYLAAHFVVERLQRRFLFVTGAEYVLLGALLGPTFAGVSLLDDLTALAPFIALAAGWVGLLYGMELDPRGLLATREPVLRLVGFEAVGTGIVVAGVSHAFFSSGYLVATPEEAWMSAAVMGCTAAAGSSSAVDLVARHYGLEGGLVDLLRREARLSDLLAIVVFGAMFCVFHQGAVATARPVTPTEWAALTVVLGVVLGLLFTVFLGEDESANGRFLALTGIIAFASGAAYLLRLAPLAVNLILGSVLGSTARDGKGLHDTLLGTMRPMSLVLLVFAGALWQPPDLRAAAVASIAYVGLRLSAKIIGCWLASIGTELRGDLSRGLLAQGDVAVAMALSFRLVYDGAVVDVAYTAILVGVGIHELLAPRVLKALLVDVGDVRQEVASHV